MALLHGFYGTAAAKGWNPTDEDCDAPFSRQELHLMAEQLPPGSDSYFEAFCRLEAQKRSRERWGEKTPRHIFRIDEILGRYPGAQIICMVRDPRAVVASYGRFAEAPDVTRAWFPAKRNAWSSEDRTRIRRSYHPLIAAMLWKASVHTALVAIDRFGVKRVRIQRFEDLVQEPESTLRELCEWLGLDFDLGMIDNVPYMNSSFAKPHVKAGISTTPVSHWHQHLTPAEIHVIQSTCGKYMGEFAYSCEAVKPPWHSVARLWLNLPTVVLRALLANRYRIAGGLDYLRRRVRFTAWL